MLGRPDLRVRPLSSRLRKASRNRFDSGRIEPLYAKVELTGEDIMRRIQTILTSALAVTVLSAFPASAVFVPGPDVEEKLQEALILASPGDTIELGEGVFEFVGSLSLDVDNVTIKGAGPGKTILSFKKQDAGSEGLTVTSNGVTLRDFAVEDTVGDAIKVKGAKGISFINLRVEWTDGPKSTNGAYGLYPVASRDVLVDGCTVMGASDAGIYIGQSQNIIVRNSTVKFNVAGIEIENCYDADVYDNLATHNTGGILVFDLPNLPQQGGRNIRVFNNTIVDNDTKNFAPEGNIVGFVPTGTGLNIMANTNVEVFGNEFSGNGTGNVMIRSYMDYNGRRKAEDDNNYYPYPRNIYIHDNTFGTGGFKPMGVRGEMFASAIGGGPIPDIMWDGVRDEKKIRKGELSATHGIFIENNGDADFINLDLTAFLDDSVTSKPSRDISAHKGSLPPLKPIELPQDNEKT